MKHPSKKYYFTWTLVIPCWTLGIDLLNSIPAKAGTHGEGGWTPAFELQE